MVKPGKGIQTRSRPSLANPKPPADGDLFRIVAETTTDVILTIDEHRRILFVNSAVEHVLG